MDNLLTEGLQKLNIACDEDMLHKVELFYELLIDKNKVMNLTRITDRDDFYVKHVLDSLLISGITGVTGVSGKKIIDIGTGAGFPGIPLKIFYPDTDMVLLDSVNKKLLFINEVIEELELENIRTVHGRAEELGHDPTYREKFDMAVSRAVADLSVLTELCMPFVRVGGAFISYKSQDSMDEIERASNAVGLLSGEADTYDVKLPGTDIVRKLVMINKTGSNPSKYPRKPGVPGRKPL